MHFQNFVLIHKRREMFCFCAQNEKLLHVYHDASDWDHSILFMNFSKWVYTPCPHHSCLPPLKCLIMMHDDWNTSFRVLHQQCIYESVLITVINELEGLSRGMMKQISSTSSIVMAPALCEKLEKQKLGSRNDPQHAAMVTQACKSALAFLKSKNPAVK